MKWKPPRPKPKHREMEMPDSMKRKPIKGKCRWCDKDITNAKGEVNFRLTWHPECVTIYMIAKVSTTARAHVFKRDKGICSKCGFECTKLEERLRKIENKMHRLASRRYQKARHAGMGWIEADNRFSWTATHKRFRALRKKIDWAGPGDSLWQVDHVQALCGAGRNPQFFALDNLMTLCLRCHKVKSKEDVRKLRAGEFEAPAKPKVMVRMARAGGPRVQRKGY